MNLDHEYAKIQQNYNKRIISEEQYNYECYKLQCTSNKYNLDWKCPIRINESVIDQSLIDDDYKELKSLYENGLLKKAYYERDLKKIISICESLKVPFPGPKTIKESLNINYISSLIIENELIDGGGDELYDELDDEDEYGDEDEVAEPVLDDSITVSNVTLERWIVGSEYEYMAKSADGTVLDPDSVIAYIVDNSDELRNTLLKSIEETINLYEKSSIRSAPDRHEYIKVYSEVYQVLKAKQMQHNPDMVGYLNMDEVFSLFGEN